MTVLNLYEFNILIYKVFFFSITTIVLFALPFHFRCQTTLYTENFSMRKKKKKLGTSARFSGIYVACQCAYKKELLTNQSHSTLPVTKWVGTDK